MNDIIILAVQLGIAVAAFVLGKYIFPNVPKSVMEKLNTLAQWASQFVVWAKEFMQSNTGEEKMAKVVEKLKEIADEAGIKVTEDQLKAIVQSAYEAMKAGEKEVYTATTPLEAAAITPTIVINTGTAAVATNNVPDGALEPNADGSVNTYDGAGNKTGTITKKEAEKAVSNVSATTEEDNG